MKELSIEQKAEAYDEAIERYKAKQEYESQRVHEFIEYLFSELKESKGERIRNFISNELACLRATDEKGTVRYNELTEAIAWLEKQGQTFTKKDVDDAYLKGVCDAKHELEKQGEQKPAECRQETEPNGGIVCEDFNEGDGYYKVNLAYLSKSQVEIIENLVVSWQNHTNNTPEWSEEDEANLNAALSYINDDALKEFIKSLRPQKYWKPSEEQLKSLEIACDRNDRVGFDLTQLLEELKKLKNKQL